MIKDCESACLPKSVSQNRFAAEGSWKPGLHNDSLKVSLIDCTIRDGGYLNNWEFSDNEILDCYKAVTEAGYDYFEIGFKRSPTTKSNIKSKWYYCLDEDIDNVIDNYAGCKINVMVEPLKNDVSIYDFRPKEESKISMVRLLTKVNQSQKRVVEFANELIDYGYEVCINLSCGDIINEEEIVMVASEFHHIKIKALYLADTYGGFNTYNLPSQLHKFYSEFNNYSVNIPFGFHCHDNNGDALSKTTCAICNGCSMIDSCIGGLGRGSGNLKSEQLMSQLCVNDNEYIQKITPLIVYFNKHILSKEDYMKSKHVQAHPYYMISGKLSLHPDYISEILAMNTDVKTDIEMILKIDKYTKSNNKRTGYDSGLLKFLIKL